MLMLLTMPKIAVPYTFLQRGSGEGGADHLSGIQ